MSKLANIVAGIGIFYLAAPQASADAFSLPLDGDITVVGDLLNPSEIEFHLSYGVSFNPQPIAPGFDISFGTFNGSTTINGAQVFYDIGEQCYSGNCSFLGVVARPNDILSVFPGEMPLILHVSTSIQTQNVSSFTYEVSMTLPDGLSVTPLPGTFGLFLGGVGVFAALARRKRRLAKDA